MAMKHIKLFEDYTGGMKEKKKLNSLLFKEVRHLRWVENPSIDEVKRLLDLGADPNARDIDPKDPDRMDATPLMVVAYDWKSPEAARLLLDRGADPNARTRSGDTPLSYAVNGGKAEAVRFLLDAGSDVNTVDARGSSLLIGGNNAEITRMLLDAGLDPKKPSPSGTTPLHSASVSSDPDVLKALIDAGADVNAIDEDGNTPLDVAKRHASSYASPNSQRGMDRIKLLILSGADPTTAFDSMQELIDFFAGYADWIPDSVAEKMKKRSRSRGAFGRF